jgi:hypothetical protein
MATIEHAMRDLIIADATIASYISTRVYTGNLPGSPTYPLIIEYNISAKTDNTVSVETVRMQYSIFGQSQTDCRAIGRRLVKLLAGKYGVTSGVTIVMIRHMITNDLIREDDTGLFETAVDFRVSYRI